MTTKLALTQSAYIFIIGMSFFMFSCEKENAICTQYTKQSDNEPILYDTVYSNPYLGAFPGSWWAFSNGDIISCEWENFKGYTIFKTDKENCIKYIQEFEIPLPKIKGVYTTDRRSAYIKDTYITKQGEKEVLYAEQLRFVENQKWDALQNKRKVEAILQSVTLPNGVIFNDVIKISEEHKVESHTGGESYFYFLYYARDFGLVWEDKPYAGGLGGPATTRYITNYYIAPH